MNSLESETVAARYLAPLLPALSRLDRMLERATAAAEAAFGGKAATDPYRGLYIASEDVRRLLAREPGVSPLTSGESGEPLPETGRLEYLRRTFGLIDFDLDIVLIALASEIDLRYERLFAYLQDDVTRRRPSVDLVLNLLCDTREAKFAARTRFLPDAPLVRSRLLHLIADNPLAPLLSHFLRLDEAAVRVLLGHACLDQRVASFAELVDQPGAPPVLSPPQDTLSGLEKLARDARDKRQPLRIYLQGPRNSGQRQIAERLAHAAGARLVSADLSRAAVLSPDFDIAISQLFREAQLHDAVLAMEAFDVLRPDDRAPLLDAALARTAESGIIVVLSGDRPWAPLRLPDGGRANDVLAVPLPAPDFKGRRQRWESRLAEAGLAASAEDVDALASRFRLTAAQIDDAIVAAGNQARLRAASGQSEGPPSLRELLAAARAQTSHDLGTLARKITPLYSWKDIVLPPDQMAQLREVCSQARYRHIVYGEWGFDRKLSLGKGLSALFSGPPGTGKSMAAEVIANELGLDLYKIDLSQVVSKYIGETEKNLNRIFAEARAANAIIFFDEADALFGKRSEVRDAHDRYANIEIAYLLQKMDEYEGISILATNLRQNLDTAFTRRLTFTVEFPFPDERSRREIWQSIWPKETQLDRDLDLDFVAGRLKIPGGSVKNIAVAAAFLAAEDRSEVKTVHLLRAARREYEKMGRTGSRAEFGAYWDQVAIPAGGGK